MCFLFFGSVFILAFFASAVYFFLLYNGRAVGGQGRNQAIGRKMNRSVYHCVKQEVKSWCISYHLINLGEIKRGHLKESGQPGHGSDQRMLCPDVKMSQ